jgi:glycosyltransferase involved in cell wall biosynthesis
LDRTGKFDFGALKRLVSYISEAQVDALCSINTYPLIYGFLAKLRSKGRRLRLLATTNETKFVRRSDELKMLLYAPMLRRADNIIFGSAYQQRLWVDQYRLDNSRCSYIHNGVNSDHYRHSGSSSMSQSIRTGLNIPCESFVVGSIGQFRKEKQYHVVVQACIELRKNFSLDVHCILVGGGFEEEKLKRFVEENNCNDFVHLIAAKDDVRPYLETMDVFVLSSISETFSNAALEAMSMSLPLVLPRVGGCPEMVREGETGFIYEPGDLSGFVECLRLLGADKTRRLDMGLAARRFIETDFQFDSMVSAYASLFNANAA